MSSETDGPADPQTSTSRTRRSNSSSSAQRKHPASPNTRHQPSSYFNRRPSRSWQVSENLTSTEERSDQLDQAKSDDAEDEDELEEDGDSEDEDGVIVEEEDGEVDPISLKERQSLINVEHPFGLPIWKPALYKKSRSVTRYADEALHSVPSAQAERHLLPGNIFWALAFGWWLGAVCSLVSLILYMIPFGGHSYSSLIFGLGWYLAWPFGKYVEGDVHKLSEDEEEGQRTPMPADNSERTTLRGSAATAKSYGAAITSIGSTRSKDSRPDYLGTIIFWLLFITTIAPLMLFVCILCWAMVITIPMARLTWALLGHLVSHPRDIRFFAAPPAVIVAEPPPTVTEDSSDASERHPTIPAFAFKFPRLAVGQTAPTSSSATVLLCVYRATGIKYFKYTVGGVNILFINLLGLVFLVILDGLVLLPWVEGRHHQNLPVPELLELLVSQALLFIMSLASVIPLSYFIGMAVASISAQSSIGMGAVINATFGSVIEVILYALALKESKGRLVEGSIVGSLLAGVLLMPGMSMCAAAWMKKEQKFNAKSAGVTSMMLIMAFIGTLAPTLFYQTYGNFKLICNGCPDNMALGRGTWQCDRCYNLPPDPVTDPFYQSTVKHLMYLCTGVLLFSYLIGLWFSLRTHASQIWQNPQQLLQTHAIDPKFLDPRNLPIYEPSRTLSRRPSKAPSLRRRPSTLTSDDPNTPRPQHSALSSMTSSQRLPSPVRRVSYAPTPPLPHHYNHHPTQSQHPSSSHPQQIAQPAYTPLLESVDAALKQSGGVPGLELPVATLMTQDDFTRAVAVATVSALRHQNAVATSPLRMRASGVPPDHEDTSQGHSGHDGPNWNRKTSAAVLLVCTALYAMIAEILVDVVDVVLKGSGIDEKFLGVTLFALVPNTTEFMNAISFALNGNISLSMEIGSAYALQVCLLQIPAMVIFSAVYAPDRVGDIANTFTLIFPRWDVIAIILSVFLMTYTYIEAKSNYHRGSILILSYVVLVGGFFYAPASEMDVDIGNFSAMQDQLPISWTQWCKILLFSVS